MPTHETGTAFETLIDRIRSEVYRQLDSYDREPRRNLFVVHTFPDAVILRNEYEPGKLYEATYQVDAAGAVTFGALREVALTYVRKRLQDRGESLEPELTGLIVQKSTARQIAYAAVLVPGEPDSDGDTLTAQRIEETAHEFLAAYRNVDLQHTLNNVAVPVESYITPAPMAVKHGDDEVELPAGTWIMAAKVLDDTTWGGIEDGTLTGFSIMGIPRTTAEAAFKSAGDDAPDMALKRTTLRDLGADWITCAVSIVDTPAVPKAKFFALKSQAKSKEAPWYLRFIPKHDYAETPVVAEKAGRRISDSTLRKLRAAYESLSALITDAEDERSPARKSNEEVTDMPLTDQDKADITAAVDAAVKAAVEPLRGELEALKQAPAQATAEKAGEQPAGESTAETPEAATKAKGEADAQQADFQAAVLKRLEDIEKSLPVGTASSKSLPGQDGEETPAAVKAVDDGRDGFGRKRRGSR
jgi:hypothetical protein